MTDPRLFLLFVWIAYISLMSIRAGADPTNGDTIQSNATATVQSYVDCTLNGCTGDAEPDTITTATETTFIYNQ